MHKCSLWDKQRVCRSNTDILHLLIEIYHYTEFSRVLINMFDCYINLLLTIIILNLYHSCVSC